MSGVDLAKSSLLAAALNSFVAIVLRLLTFVSNAFILRYVSREALGIINVRLLLFSDTILFISREAFRKACLGRSPDGDWKGTINLIWISCPISILSSLFLGYFWKYWLEMPSTEDETDQYRVAIDLMALSGVVETFCEPFFIVGQVNKFIRFRSVADFVHLAVRTFIMVAVVVVYPEKSIILFGFAHLLATAILLIINVIYFGYSIKKSKLPSSFTSVKSFLPSVSGGDVDRDRISLVVAFLKQGLVKQVLTEGEKYMFTCFSLMTLTQQGVYDVVGNLGSLAARLVFSKIEESAYFYFTQTVSRDKDKKNKDNELEAMTHLIQILRWMTLLGLIVCSFGFSFSHLLLNLYGGEKLSHGLGTQLLRGHCVFVLFMAINGVSECFSFAVMSKSDVDVYNYTLGVLSVVFLFLAWIFSTWFGPVGFIAANCTNFAFRIWNNFKVIESHRKEFDLDLKISGILPTTKTLITIVASASLCHLSEIFVYEAGIFSAVVKHLIFGGSLFSATLFFIVFEEPVLKSFVLKLVPKIRKTD